MASNREWLDQCELIKIELLRGMKFVGAYHELFTHAAISVHPEHLDVGAAIRFAPTAGDTFSAVQVGLHRALVAWFDSFNPFTRFQDLHSEFMPEDSGIRKKRLAPRVGVNVRSANTDTANSHQGLSRAGSLAKGCDREFQFTRFDEGDCLHAETRTMLLY